MNIDPNEIYDDDDDYCPDCGGDDLSWVEGTYYERGERTCNNCNPDAESMFDDYRYDAQKDDRAERRG